MNNWKDKLVKDHRFTAYEVERLIKTGQAVDGSAGGLILGRSHNNGGIPVLTQIGDDYYYNKEFEGFEFMFSSAAYYTYGSYCELELQQ